MVENAFSISRGRAGVVGDASNEILHPIIKSSHKSSGDGRRHRPTVQCLRGIVELSRT